MSEFTKGEWFADGPFVGTAHQNHDIVSAAGDYHMPRAELAANANLIAAAPELYEALNDLLNDCINFDGGRLTSIFQVNASKALRKASGKGE